VWELPRVSLWARAKSGQLRSLSKINRYEWLSGKTYDGPMRARIILSKGGGALASVLRTMGLELVMRLCKLDSLFVATGLRSHKSPVIRTRQPYQS
jgi:hypothetical protein